MSQNRYLEYEKLLQAEGSADTPSVYQGFILGLAVNHFPCADKVMRKKIQDFLNGGEPLPGSLIAMITDLAVDAENDLKQGKLNFLLPESEHDKLSALSGLAYGLSMALPFKVDGTTHKSAEVMDAVMTLSDIGKVDEEGDFSSDDFQVILDFIAQTLLKIYKQN